MSLREVRRKSAREWLMGSAETLVAMVLVLGFFLIVLGTLTLSFPKGTGLRNLYGDLVLPAREEQGLSFGVTDEDDSAPIARLTSVRRLVRDRPVHALAWEDAHAGASIGNRHALQTMARSGAVVAMTDGGRLELGENSLVVLRRSERRRDYRSGRAALVVLGGNVKGDIGKSGSDLAPLDLVISGADATILPEGDKPAEFDVAVNPDSSSTLRMTAGSAEITSGGETAVVGPNYAMTIVPDQPLGKPQRIPDAPQLLSPDEGFSETFGSVVPKVQFRWDPQNGADGYRLTLSRDAEFSEIVHDVELSEAQFDHESLQAGRYFWRVSAIHGSVRGRPSVARSLRLERDARPPALAVDLPENVTEDRVTVRGTTEPGATVLIGKNRVPTATSGTFEYTLTLRRGPNVVVIEAVDAAGNVAYFSEYVHAKF